MGPCSISGPALTQALKDGIAAIGGEVTDYNLLSTPQLHYIVRCLNTAGTPDAYGVPTEAGYYEKLGSAFKKFAVRDLDRFPIVVGNLG